MQIYYVYILLSKEICIKFEKKIKPFGNEGIRKKKNMKIILVGYMGSGKSSIGQQLATRLNYTFKDLDTAIESSEGANVTTIFSEKGEIYFRKKENTVLKELISSSENIVLATGGGTPCYGNVMELLLSEEDCVTVYLKGSVAVLTDRLFLEKEKRPLISHLETKELLNDFIRKHLFERSYYYNQASLKVDIDDASIEGIVETILLKLL